MPVLSVQNLIQDRVATIRDYHQHARIEVAELDVSGGIDSAVMCGLLARAVPKSQLGCVFSGIHSSEESLRRARLVTEAFGVRLVEVDLSAEYESISQKIVRGMSASGFDAVAIAARREDSLAVDGSFRSCLRAPIGRYVNRLMGGGVRHGTGNECEDRFVRFYQKGGDGEVDTNPIAMLSKGEVYQLARGLGVPREVIDAEPSHDLHRGAASSHDEVELKAWTGVDWTYSRIDVETGEYRRVGTIERMSRLMDSILLERGLDDAQFWSRPDLLEEAKSKLERVGLSRVHLDSAIKLEAQTRHKHNPNCPTLGTRSKLLELGILTNAVGGER